MAKVSLMSQIGALENVVNGRYPVIHGSMATRQLINEQLTAALETLRWVKANEAEFRAWAAERKAGRT